MSDIKQIKAYTDGSAVILRKQKNINGPGGFGVYFPDLFGSRKAYSLGFKSTKTGRMEVMAALYAIKAIPIHKNNTELKVYSDSEYVVKTFSEGRLFKWKANGWRNTSGEVKNKDLWIAIHHEVMLRLSNDIFVKFEHIRSHQVEKEKNIFARKMLMKDPNIIGNMMADRLADYKRHKILLESDKI